MTSAEYMRQWRESNYRNPEREAALRRARMNAYKALAKKYPEAFKRFYRLECQKEKIPAPPGIRTN